MIQWEPNDEPAPKWHNALPQTVKPAQRTEPTPPPVDLTRWHGPVTGSIEGCDDDPGTFDDLPDGGSPWPGALYVAACAGAVICGLGAAGAYTLGGAGWGWWLAGFAACVAFLVCATAKEGI
jgi:hypothetical protein